MDKKMNLLQGLENFTNGVNSEINQENHDIKDVIILYAMIESLVDKAKELNMWNEIIYPCQALQARLMDIAKRLVRTNK